MILIIYIISESSFLATPGHFLGEGERKPTELERYFARGPIPPDLAVYYEVQHLLQTLYYEVLHLQNLVTVT